jgi:hypothetical protein
MKFINIYPYARFAFLKSKHLHSRKKCLILWKNDRKVNRIRFRSKKRVRWVIKYGESTHSVTCTISFYSGKKLATHNGYTILNTEDSKE